jgi:hypothetical protein
MHKSHLIVAALFVLPLLILITVFFSKRARQRQLARERIEKMTPREINEEAARISASIRTLPKDFNPVRIDEIQGGFHNNPFVPPPS